MGPICYPEMSVLSQPTLRDNPEDEKIKEVVQRVCLNYPCRRQVFGALVSSTTSDRGCLPRYPTKHPSRAAATCRSVDVFIYDSLHDGNPQRFRLAVWEFLNN